MTEHLTPLGPTWQRTRPARTLLHLDSAAAGRSSWAVLDAAAAHLRREAERGAYVAALEAAGELETARSHVRALLGWQPGEGVVAFVHSAEDALRQVLLRWPGDLPVTVAHPRGEYGPNLAVVRGLGIGTSVVDGPHRWDPEAFAASFAAARPDLVHLTWLGSHAGTVQPLADVLSVCRAADLPVVVDAAQAFGHLDTTPARDADVVYGTSRKWLAGPRGVGFVAVRGALADRTGGLEQAEANVAGRVGLAATLAQHVELGPTAVQAGLAAVGAATRRRLADELAGTWEVLEDADEPSATVTLRPVRALDVAGLRADLIAHDGIVTTHLGTERAPLEMAAPALRVSGHLDTTGEDVDALARALLRRS
ncbi:aminotransferase class V-fold PLP-dependent enzyme [Kineococcus rhizosphaerae]|uniref:Pyridoxal 5-phosphate dependent beta-lyase n=1 Tax=Kineococcus rhizosphaerae TaxID=559628 RepID=A0A2T0QUX0_9ACTN|nr:aminotransferase class V-fold PLP-dependent enzyme [Kineococcus rhizosphaerae]PRY09082.1 pyridoxal 5-phosphate dependent beta-lyase [Kineococcus rhizosphaerae]